MPSGLAGNVDAVLGHACEHPLDRSVIPECDIAADVEPSGIAWNPRLGKDDELRVTIGRRLRELPRAREAVLEVTADLVLHDGDPNATHASRDKEHNPEAIVGVRPKTLDREAGRCGDGRQLVAIVLVR